MLTSGLLVSTAETEPLPRGESEPLCSPRRGAETSEPGKEEQDKSVLLPNPSPRSIPALS